VLFAPGDVHEVVGGDDAAPRASRTPADLDPCRGPAGPIRVGDDVVAVPVNDAYAGAIAPDTHAAMAQAYGPMVLSLRGDQISAITWFGGRAVMARFGLPGTRHT
jgi:hypothetical protein